MVRALVIGASGGIGKSLVDALAKRGNEVYELSRRINGLDVTDESSIQSHLNNIDGPLDLVIIATGELASDPKGPEKSIKALNASAMADQFAVNAIGPMLVFKHVVKHLPRERRSVLAALSARVGSIGDNQVGGWYSYRASKAALNQYIRTASIELARSHKHAICLALHPGTVATKFTENYRNHPAVEPETAANNLLGVIDNATKNDTGKFYDWAGKEVPW